MLSWKEKLSDFAISTFAFPGDSILERNEKQDKSDKCNNVFHLKGQFSEKTLSNPKGPN